jgi:hypothetical protein
MVNFGWSATAKRATAVAEGTANLLISVKSAFSSRRPIDLYCATRFPAEALQLA